MENSTDLDLLNSVERLILNFKRENPNVKKVNSQIKEEISTIVEKVRFPVLFNNQTYEIVSGKRQARNALKEGIIEFVERELKKKGDKVAILVKPVEIKSTKPVESRIVSDVVTEIRANINMSGLVEQGDYDFIDVSLSEKLSSNDIPITPMLLTELRDKVLKELAIDQEKKEVSKKTRSDQEIVGSIAESRLHWENEISESIKDHLKSVEKKPKGKTNIKEHLLKMKDGYSKPQFSIEKFIYGINFQGSSHIKDKDENAIHKISDEEIERVKTDLNQQYEQFIENVSKIIEKGLSSIEMPKKSEKRITERQISELISQINSKLRQIEDSNLLDPVKQKKIEEYRRVLTSANTLLSEISRIDQQSINLTYQDLLDKFNVIKIEKISKKPKDEGSGGGEFVMPNDKIDDNLKKENDKTYEMTGIENLQGKRIHYSNFKIEDFVDLFGIDSKYLDTNRQEIEKKFNEYKKSILETIETQIKKLETTTGEEKSEEQIVQVFEKAMEDATSLAGGDMNKLKFLADLTSSYQSNRVDARQGLERLRNLGLFKGEIPTGVISEDDSKDDSVQGKGDGDDGQFMYYSTRNAKEIKRIEEENKDLEQRISELNKEIRGGFGWKLWKNWTVPRDIEKLSLAIRRNNRKLSKLEKSSSGGIRTFVREKVAGINNNYFDYQKKKIESLERVYNKKREIEQSISNLKLQRKGTIGNERRTIDRQITDKKIELKEFIRKERFGRIAEAGKLNGIKKYANLWGEKLINNDSRNKALAALGYGAVGLAVGSVVGPAAIGLVGSKVLGGALAGATTSGLVVAPTKYAIDKYGLKNTNEKDRLWKRVLFGGTIGFAFGGLGAYLTSGADATPSTSTDDIKVDKSTTPSRAPATEVVTKLLLNHEGGIWGDVQSYAGYLKLTPTGAEEFYGNLLKYKTKQVVDLIIELGSHAKPPVLFTDSEVAQMLASKSGKGIIWKSLDDMLDVEEIHFKSFLDKLKTLAESTNITVTRGGKTVTENIFKLATMRK